MPGARGTRTPRAEQERQRRNDGDDDVARNAERLHAAVVDGHRGNDADRGERLSAAEKRREHERRGGTRGRRRCAPPGATGFRDGNGRVGCATLSISKSRTSLSALANAVSSTAIAGHDDRLRLVGPTGRPPRAEDHAGHREQRVLPPHEREDREHRLPNRVLIQRLVLPHDVVARETRPRVHAAASALIVCQRSRSERISTAAAAIASTSPTRGAHQSRRPSRPRGDRRLGCQRPARPRERLERAQAERLALRRQQKQVRAREQRRDRIDLAEEVHVVLMPRSRASCSASTRRGRRRPSRARRIASRRARRCERRPAPASPARKFETCISTRRSPFSCSRSMRRVASSGRRRWVDEVVDHFHVAAVQPNA